MSKTLIFNSCLLVSSISLFIVGFFILKIPPDRISNRNTNLTDFQPINRVVLIVIDALRYDFLHRPGVWSFIDEIVARGQGVKLRANAQSPTVTMPRIKALMTGTVPSFSDVILNLASPKLAQDNLLHQWRANGKKIWFFGDDTWLKLYPNNTFDKFDGTTSFFVKDFVEVDNNVTRHIPSIINNYSHWNSVILHYLGLDHIGHTLGPRSTKINDKLREMDKVVYNLYQKLIEKDENVVMFVIGDHGMSEVGGHGGASFLERSAGALILSPKITIETEDDFDVEQIDILPLISLLTGVPIPAQSLGVAPQNLLRKFVPFIDPKVLLSGLLLNLHQICTLSNSEAFCEQIQENFNTEVTSVGGNNLNPILIKIEQKCKDLRDELLDGVQDFGHGFLGLAIALCGITLSLQIWHLKTMTECMDLKYCKQYMLPILAAILSALTFFSSSFVEEEHQTWYFVWTSLLILLLWEELSNWLQHQRNDEMSVKLSCAIFTLLILHRIGRSWVATGVKWNHMTDVSKLLQSDFPSAVPILSTISMIIAVPIVQSSKSDQASKLGYLLSIISIMILCLYHSYPVISNSFRFDLWLPRILYIFSAVLMCINFEISIIILAFLWCKPTLHPLILIMLISRQLVGKILQLRLKRTRNEIESSFIIWIFAKVLFFEMGNSNSLSSIDISVGFIGLDSYIPAIIAPIMFIYHFMAPIIAVSIIRLDSLRQNSSVILVIFLLNQSIFVFITLLVCFTFKYHIFVWSVFAPKLFYECFHTIFVICLCFVVSLFAPKREIVK